MSSPRNRFRLGGHNLAQLAFGLVCVLSTGTSAHAQSSATEKPRRVSLSYFGESAVNPGVRLAYDGTAYVSGANQLFMTASIGGYSTSPGYALFIFLGGGYRLALSSGLFLDLQIGIGYNALNRPGMNQMTADGGVVQSAPTVGNYFMPIGLGGLGFDFQPRMKVPVALFARGGGYGLTGTGEPFQGSYLLDVGLAYQFGTGKPTPVQSPVPSPPPAEAPANLESQPDPNRVPLVIPPDGQPPVPPLVGPNGPTMPAGPIAPIAPAAPPAAPSLFPPGSPSAAPGMTQPPTVPALPPPPASN